MKWGLTLRAAVYAGAVALMLAFAGAATAETILKLSLGNDALPDVHFDGVKLGTIVDPDPLTTGDQNTAVEFLGFLGFMSPIPTADASFTLHDVMLDGPAIVTAVGPASIVNQSFLGGSLALYDDTDALLLSAVLDHSVLSGPLGAPATGALFTTTLGSLTGGSLASMIAPNTISLSMSFTNVSGGAGFSVTSTPGGYELNPFTADVTENIAADQRAIPEPATAVLAVLGCLVFPVIIRRRV